MLEWILTMSARARLCAALALVGWLTLAHAQQRCCSPEKMEMRGSYSMGSGPKKPTLTEATITTLAYDYTTQKVAVREMVYINNGSPINMTAIMDFSQGMNYFISSGVCQKVKQNEPMKPRCVPEEAAYNGRMHVGSREAGVDLDSWTLTFDLEQVSGQTSSMYEPVSCYPVTDYVKSYDKNTGEGGTSSLMYFDVKPSISDPSIFEVPSICDNA